MKDFSALILFSEVSSFSYRKDWWMLSPFYITLVVYLSKVKAWVSYKLTKHYQYSINVFVAHTAGRWYSARETIGRKLKSQPTRHVRFLSFISNE